MRANTTIARSIAAALASIFLLASRPAAAAPPTDACSLLTQAQVTAAVGVPVDPGKAVVATACQWQQPGKTGANLLKLDVTIIKVEQFNAGKTMGGPATSTPVDGLGDDAYYSVLAAAKIATLRVKKGNVAFAIRVWGGVRPLDEAQAKEKAVAQAILSKL